MRTKTRAWYQDCWSPVMTQGRFHIGTSGWHYKHWIGSFYPPGTKPDQQFNFYKQKFNTVEINNSFYRLPSPEVFKGWRKHSPPDFLFVVKASRYITHLKKLMDPGDTTKKFFANVKFLRDKLGPILFQLPPTWKINVLRLEEFLATLPGKYRYVFEFRNSSWYSPEVYDLLRRYNVGFCIYELAGHISPVNVTADFVYVRLHGPGDKYQGSYNKEQLTDWAHQCREWLEQRLDVFVYFDNDQNGYAAFNAQELFRMLDRT